MTTDLAPAITRAASRQTYYTIRFLVDRARVDDAYRAYAYFRWLDDALDAGTPCGRHAAEAARTARAALLERQRALLDRCLRGDPPTDPGRCERMLVDLVRHADRTDGGLDAYLHHMMLVMDFDVRRRGRLVSAAELDEYTRWLAVAVTEAMHYFIGNGAAAPRDETRYLAVSGAHILHMLRDTYADVRAGYFNIPREVLDAGSIGPADVHSNDYRAWVESRVLLSRSHFDAGRRYFERVASSRHRLAGLAYMSRFEWLIEALVRDGFRVRPRYREQDGAAAALAICGALAGSVLRLRAPRVEIARQPEIPA